MGPTPPLTPHSLLYPEWWGKLRGMATTDICPISPQKGPHGQPGGPGPCCWAVTRSASGNAKAPSGPWPPSPERRKKLDRQEDGTEGPALAGAKMSQIGSELPALHWACLKHTGKGQCGADTRTQRQRQAVTQSDAVGRLPGTALPQAIPTRGTPAGLAECLSHVLGPELRASRC